MLKIAVFLIPGSLFLIYLCVIFPVLKEKVVFLLWEQPKITHWVLVGLVCLIAGSLIDFLRATLTSLVQWIGRFGKHSAGFFETLRVSDGLTGRTYTYQYLAFNISLSILVGSGLSRLKALDSTFWTAFSSPWILPVFGVVLSVVTLGISYWKAHRTTSKLKTASQANKKCEGGTSCPKDCHPKDHPSTC